MSAESAADRGIEEAVAFVLRSTRASPQTEAELAGKLRDRGADEATAEAALARARELGAVDDEAFARAWVADRAEGRGYARARVRRELTRRGVPDHVADAALACLDGRDEEAVAEASARQRYARLPGELPPERAASRLAAFLARRGHPQTVAERVAIRVAGLDRVWD